MIVSTARRFIFIHNPKASGTSIRQTLSAYHDHEITFWHIKLDPFFGIQHDLAHLRGWEIASFVPDLYRDLGQYRKLVLVRNPVRRFISACFEHFTRYRREIGFADQSPDLQRQQIKALIADPQFRQRVITDHRFVHFSPQSWFVSFAGQRLADHILPMSGAAEDFRSVYDILELPRRPVPRMNKRAADSFEAIVDAELEMFVHKFYAIDYDMLDCHDHLKHLA